MKKFIPLIISLITLSIVALMYIQTKWISNTIRLQRITYDSKVYSAAEGIHRDLQNVVIDYRGVNPKALNYNLPGQFLWSVISLIPEETIHSVINNNLESQDIDIKFDYCIMNGNIPINHSLGFTESMVENSFSFPLSNDGIYNILIFMHQPKDYLLKKSIGLIISAILFTLIIISTFWVTIYSMLMQRKLSEVKSDFINNMTHEFKTPIATVSLALDALAMDKVKSNPEQLSFYTKIIKDENTRMTKQVEKILQAAQIEKNELEITLQPIDVNEVINQMANNFQLRFMEKSGQLELDLQAKNTIIDADDVHFSNIIFNLMDNAVKYSKESDLKVIVRTQNDNKGHIIISFIDNGIGMNRETQSRIFERFYRAHTGDLHNVKGFGLGLTYVKAVVDVHKANIKVESTLGKGSSFILTFNLAKEQKLPENNV